MITKFKKAYAIAMTFYDVVIEKVVRYPDFALALAIVAVAGALMV